MQSVIAAMLIAAYAGAGGFDDDRQGGGVFVLSNEAAGNRLAVFGHGRNGALSLRALVPTGGLGSGGGLGNQGAVLVQGETLYAVNAASNTISVFEIDDEEEGEPELIQQISSQGVRPISLTASGRTLYVLNAGSDQIAGFTIRNGGRLAALPNSIRPLSGAGVGSAQVSFSNSGDYVAVTEKATNRIDVYAVGPRGLLSAPVVSNAAGATPFGFAFDSGDRLVVSEASGGASKGSTISSYSIDPRTLRLTPVTAALPTGETAACWVATTSNGRFAFATNTGSATISPLSIDFRSGAVALNGPATASVATPTDFAVRRDRVAYVLSPSTGSVGVFLIGANGGLTPWTSAGGLPLGSATGLATR